MRTLNAALPVRTVYSIEKCDLINRGVHDDTRLLINQIRVYRRPRPLCTRRYSWKKMVSVLITIRF